MEWKDKVYDMNIYLQSTGKTTPKNTWIQQQSFKENYFYIYQTIGVDWRIVHDTCNRKADWNTVNF